MKLSKETRFYYLDYLQKQINKVGKRFRDAIHDENDFAILEEFKNTNLPLYSFLLNKWYIDELYDLLFVKPAKKIGSFFW